MLKRPVARPVRKVQDQLSGPLPEFVGYGLPVVASHRRTADSPNSRLAICRTLWTPARLKDWVDSDQPVRISGWTLLHTEHRNHLNKYRQTLWEIHPITKIEVSNNGQWVDLDNL